MKRLFLSVVMAVFFLATAVFAAAELKVEKGTEYEFCEEAKEEKTVLFTKFNTGTEVKETFRLKCVCPKKGKCYPVRTECPDEKSKDKREGK